MGRNMKPKLNKVQRLEYLRVRAQKMRESKKKSVSIADNNKESPPSLINLDNQLQPILASESNNGLEICQQYINNTSSTITSCDRLRAQKVGMESHLNCEKRNKRKQQHDVGNEDKKEQSLPYEIELDENEFKTADISGHRVVDVGVDGSKRRADEAARRHPPGRASCADAQRAADSADREREQLKGLRNTSGWLVLPDGTQFMSAGHSIACKKFSYASRGNQALACAVMAVAMSRVEDVCRWCSTTLDSILESGDQLYQDSYLHFHPPNKLLTMEQILRKFYTPGNCVCRVVVYKPRHKGVIDLNLAEQIGEFFREEKSGVFVAGNGDFAVALFRTPRGYYMFDPADRDRCARAVAPPCAGRARACLSQYPTVQSLAEKLGPNIPPATVDDTAPPVDELVRFSEPTGFTIYGMDVTSLRKLNQHER